MSKAPRRPPTPAHPPSTVTPAPDELPVIESIGLAKTSRAGWVIVMITSQGDKVIQKEILFAEPEPKTVALRRLMTLSTVAWAKNEADC